MAEPAKPRNDHMQPLGELAPGTLELMLNAVLNSATDFAIFTIDTQRHITSWNIGAQNVLGWDAAEIIGQSADILYAPEALSQGVPERVLREASSRGRAEDEGW